MTERDWQRLENSMQFVIEQQVKFEANFARIEAKFEAQSDKANKRFVHAEKRLDRLERLGERMMRAADERFKRSEARLDRLEENLTLLQSTVSDFIASLRAERRGNGRGRGRL